MDKVNMPATEVTAGQLADLIIQRLSSKITTETNVGSKMVRGLAPLAERLGVSMSTIVRLKRKEVFKDSIKQNGKIIQVDLDKAVEDYYDKTNRKGRK